MDELLDQGAPADSPAATDALPADQQTPPGAQPGTQPQAAPKDPPFHNHPRFRQLIEENRGLKGQVSELLQWRQQIEATAQRQGGLTPQQQQAYQQAGDAIEQVLRQHPRLAKLLELAERAPQMFEATQGVAELSRAQERAIHQQARSSLASLAKAESLPTDSKTLGFIEDLVAAQIMRIQDGQRRYLAGDAAVINEAFDEIKSSFLGQFRREAAQRTIDAKTNVRNLPPRPAGGTPGQAPAKTLKDFKGDERAYMRHLSQQAAGMLAGGTGS